MPNTKLRPIVVSVRPETPRRESNFQQTNGWQNIAASPMHEDYGQHHECDYWQARRAFLSSYQLSERKGLKEKMKRSVKGLNEAAMAAVLEVRREVSRRRVGVRVYRLTVGWPLGSWTALVADEGFWRSACSSLGFLGFPTSVASPTSGVLRPINVGCLGMVLSLRLVLSGVFFCRFGRRQVLLGVDYDGGLVLMLPMNIRCLGLGLGLYQSFWEIFSSRFGGDGGRRLVVDELGFGDAMVRVARVCLFRHLGVIVEVIDLTIGYLAVHQSHSMPRKGSEVVQYLEDMKIQCDVCEKAPATVICCADEAALCAKCDVEIHAANKLASKHQRLLLQSLSTKLPRCDICQDCDEPIHSAGSLSANHQRFLATGIRVALGSNCTKEIEKSHQDPKPPKHNAQPVAMKMPTAQQASSFGSPSWAVDDLLQFSDFESSDKKEQVGFGELDWFADIGLFGEQVPHQALAPAEVPQLPAPQSSNYAPYRPPKSSMPYKKPRIEISNDDIDDYFTVPDLGFKDIKFSGNTNDVISKTRLQSLSSPQLRQRPSLAATFLDDSPTYDHNHVYVFQQDDRCCFDLPSCMEEGDEEEVCSENKISEKRYESGDPEVSFLTRKKISNPIFKNADGSTKQVKAVEATLNWKSENAIVQNKKILKRLELAQTRMEQKVSPMETIISERASTKDFDHPQRNYYENGLSDFNLLHSFLPKRS
ncbi:hypothetical protein C3L33_20437, partial [Rhododendron williamsianum]